MNRNAPSEPQIRILETALDEAVHDFGSPPYVMTVCDALLEFALEHPAAYRHVLGVDGVSADNVPRRRERTADAFGLLVRCFRECQDVRSLGDSDGGDPASILAAHAHGLLSLFMIGALPFTADEFRSAYRRSITLLLRCTS